MNQLAIFFVLSLFLLCSSCARNNLSCPGNSKKYKHKKYKVKKNKRSRPVYVYGGGSTNNDEPTASNDTNPSNETTEPTGNEQEEVLAEQPKKESEEKKNSDSEETKEQTAQKETTATSIPDLKTSGPPMNDEEVIEFRGEQIVIDKDDGFQFDENIEFIDLSDLFVDRETALESLTDLSRLLKKDPTIQATIIGNTATTTPRGEELYGSSAEVLRQEAILNADTVQLRDVMIARAKRVYHLLINEGVNYEQLEYTTGTHGKWESERVVSFILRKQEEDE